MKTIKILALAISLFSSVQFANAGTNSFKISENQSVKSEITAEQIIQYLIQTGHTIVNPPVPRTTGTWVAITTIKDDGHTYLTTVYIEGQYITGYEDEILD